MLAELSTMEGDLPRARDLLMGAWGLEHPDQYCDCLPYVVVSALRAETRLVDHRDESARQESAEYVDTVMATAQQLPRQGPRGEAWWLEASAHAARAHGRDTPEQWAAAATAWEECEHRPDIARCRHHQGVAHLAAGDKEAAQTALHEALQIATALGAVGLADDVSVLARRARLQIVGVTRPPAQDLGLTPREREVLQLLAEGMSNERIAQTLFMSPKTASVHVSRILMKLGAANRTEAAATARRHGLVDL